MPFDWQGAYAAGVEAAARQINKPRKAPVRLTPPVLARAMRHEMTVLELAAGDLAAGRKLSETDQARVMLAVERITTYREVLDGK